MHNVVVFVQTEHSDLGHDSLIQITPAQLMAKFWCYMYLCNKIAFAFYDEIFYILRAAILSNNYHPSNLTYLVLKLIH